VFVGGSSYDRLVSDPAKAELTETEIRTRYITPALSAAGWPLTSLREEYYYFSAGRIQVVGSKGVRKKPKKVDYLLEWRPNLPVAVVEAKDNRHEPGDGMQQAIEYAEQLDVPSVFTSNGDSFVWHDRTGLRPEVEVEIPLEQFPSRQQLYDLYKQWKGITDADEAVISSQFHDDGSGRRPRYYQRVAVNRTLEAIAAGKRRLLLVMATGTGKTYTASQIIWCFMESFKAINPSKPQARVLFLADRNILVDQTMMNDFAMFKGRMAKLSAAHKTITTVTTPEGAGSKVVDKSFEVYLSLYQAVTGSDEIDNVYKQFSPDFFDLVIVDECHRGSVREDSAWRSILEYFSSAIQLGMTATPKETKAVSNIDYFGEALYTYSLKQGIDDGFLAPYKVVRVALDVDTFGFRPAEGQVDDRGTEIPDREYTADDIDDTIVFPERDKRVAERITQFLKSTDVYAKTIVFCQDIPAANRMRRALANLNRDEVLKDSRYVMQITGDDQQGKQEVDNFIDPEIPYPVVATTSKLLATGVDAQTCKLIVLNSTVDSMTDFKQMIGRGTRVRTDYDKWFFVILDFKNVTRLFADKDFDGDPVKVYELAPHGDMGDAIDDLNDVDETHGSDQGDQPDDGGIKRPERSARRKKLVVSGQQVTIMGEQVQMLGSDGKPLTSSLADFTRANLLKNYPTAGEFFSAWMSAERRSDLLDELAGNGIPLEDLTEQIGGDLDPFDVAADIAYGHQALGRERRAENVRADAQYLGTYHGQVRIVLMNLLNKYIESGIRAIEDIGVLRVEPLRSIGSPMEIIQLFGTREAYFEAVRELEHHLYPES
jgi:type I restriction enzyme, R subunit